MNCCKCKRSYNLIGWTKNPCCNFYLGDSDYYILYNNIIYNIDFYNYYEVPISIFTIDEKDGFKLILELEEKVLSYIGSIEEAELDCIKFIQNLCFV